VLSMTYHFPPVRVPSCAGRKTPRMPWLTTCGVSLCLGLMLLLFLAPCALAAPLVLAWDASAGATGYTIHYGNSYSNLTSTVDVGNTITASLSGLDPAKIYYVAVSAYDGAGNESDMSNMVLYQPAHPSVTWSINAGGPKYKDKQGIIYRGGAQTGYVYSTSTAIGGTKDTPLYQSERYGDFSYAIPMANGDYVVTLKFAEIYWTQPGQRVFNVVLEGVKVLSKLDLVAKVGPNTAYDVALPVSVKDGQLNIKFHSVVDYAKVSAIMVQATGVTP
jgi:Malectin domain/Fibronectin type III domain